MSLYQLQKVIYTLNRDPAAVEMFKTDARSFLSGFKLTNEENQALLNVDIGLLYVLGVNGQLLMHYAALHGIQWTDYLQLMRDGVKEHGQPRAGVYVMTTSPDEKVTI
ncbi:hypothetical protein [uncultured Hyphomonas sp.]|uniref:hypothetical protein n=1 Tax=uncultured Hyphomonas sp. TaxID=225298 RepID=UPI002AAB3ED0|nr:hypothetical protein [uncultured Hyphomonas sp.]